MKANRFLGKGNQTSDHAENVILAVLTAFSIYSGQISIFYIIYLFRWNEFLICLINGIFNFD